MATLSQVQEFRKAQDELGSACYRLDDFAQDPRPEAADADPAEVRRAAREVAEAAERLAAALEAMQGKQEG